MKYILTRMAIGAIAFYLIGAFLAGSFDPSTWDAAARAGMVFLYVLLFLAIWMSESQLKK